jgi:hypothetical protein
MTRTLPTRPRSRRIDREQEVPIPDARRDERSRPRSGDPERCRWVASMGPVGVDVYFPGPDVAEVSG